MKVTISFRPSSCCSKLKLLSTSLPSATLKSAALPYHVTFPMLQSVALSFNAKPLAVLLARDTTPTDREEDGITPRRRVLLHVHSPSQQCPPGHPPRRYHPWRLPKVIPVGRGRCPRPKSRCCGYCPASGGCWRKAPGRDQRETVRGTAVMGNWRMASRDRTSSHLCAVI